MLTLPSGVGCVNAVLMVYLMSKAALESRLHFGFGCSLGVFCSRLLAVITHLPHRGSANTIYRSIMASKIFNDRGSFGPLFSCGWHAEKALMTPLT
jgi:hypothetical protein